MTISSVPTLIALTTLGLKSRRSFAEKIVCDGVVKYTDVCGDCVPICGTTGADILYASEDHPCSCIFGLNGKDTIYGGPGDDVILGGFGFDTIYGGDGADTVYANKGSDTIYGGPGADTLFGNQGKDVLFGEDGADVYYGNAGVDHIYPGAGDTVYGGGKLDKIYLCDMENSNVEIIAPQGDEMVQLPDCLSSPPPPMPPPFPDVIAQDDKKNSPLPRAFITTDIHSMTWDPDDIQSLGHVLYFLDRLDLRGIVPDHFNNNGAFQAVDKVLNAYTDDYYNPSTKYQDLGWPTPEHVKSLVAYSKGEAVQDLINQAHDAADNGQVLYVLAWGHVCVTKDALLQDPSIAPHIRLLSIATFKKAKSDGGNCWEDNWNEWGGCRNTIYSQFPNVWFLESDWSYQGIYLPWKNQAGIDMKNSLEALGGKVGKVIGDAIDVVSWSNSFRVGDTPTVLYLIDPSNDLDDPGKGSWAGRYMRPYPDAHPNFWTGITGGNWWDFNNPCNSWGNAQAVFDARQWTVQSKKPEMYDDLLERVKFLYGTGK